MAWVLPSFLVVSLLGNVLGYILIARDKKAARAGARRRPEDTFSLLALLGLWPGMLLAMRRHRHKTRKTAFKLQLALAAAVGTVIWSLLAFAAWRIDTGP